MPASAQLRPGSPPSSSTARIPNLPATRQRQPVSSKSISPGRTSTSKLSTSSAGRRLSEDPDFEDLIMRGDTLRMTLTPSRFRQSSSDGTGTSSSSGAPRRVHGSATSLGHARKHSLLRKARVTNADRNNHDSMSSASTSSPLVSTGVKLKARAPVSSRRPFMSEEDAESTSTETDIEGHKGNDEYEDHLHADSGNDDDILGLPSHGSRRQRESKRLASRKTKESLFDILNSKPPWEEESLMKINSGGKDASGNAKADKIMGSDGVRSIPSYTATTNALQASPSTGVKRFTPIANLDVIASFDTPPRSKDPDIDGTSLDTRVREARGLTGLLVAPSIPDTTSLLSSASSDGQSDFFSTKLPVTITDRENHSSLQHQRYQGSAETFSNGQTSYASGLLPSPRLSSYKSSPVLGSLNAPDTSSTMVAAGTSSLDIPAKSSMRSSPVRRLEAKDERYVHKRVDDDLIDFLRNAEPPSDYIAPTPSSISASLPSGHNRNHSSIPNGKTRLGSVNFRSLMGRGSKRASIAPPSASPRDFPSLSEAPKSAGLANRLDSLPFVDEMGRFQSIQQELQSRAVHASLPRIGGSQLESRDLPISALPLSRNLEGLVSGNLGDTAHLAHTALRQNTYFLGSPGSEVTVTRTTLIMAGGHAASPAAKQGHEAWELAQAAEHELALEQRRLEQEKREREEEEIINRIERALIREPFAITGNGMPYGTAGSMGTVVQERRDTAFYPARTGYLLLQAPLGTPDRSRDDICRTPPNQQRRGSSASDNVYVTQARAVSGSDISPMTPKEKVHSPQFTALQVLPEEAEAKIRSPSSMLPPSTASVASASPSAVMLAMAHKHQRRLSAVKRKPSPRFEGDTVLQSDGMQMQQHIVQEASTLYEFASERSREASSSSQSSGLEPPFATTPAAILISEYRGSARDASSSKCVPETATESGSVKRAGQDSVRPVSLTGESTLSTAPLVEVMNAPTLAQIKTLARSGSATIPSRPPSTVILPVSPRYMSAGITGSQTYQADIHDVLLSLRNNMVGANSVAECLEVIDAALFEIAYDTKDSYAPSVIEEEVVVEQTSNVSATAKPTRSKNGSRERQPKASLTGEQAHPETHGAEQGEKIVEIIKLRPRTSRYVNRAYNAIIEYYLAYPSPPSIFPKGYHRFQATKTYYEPRESSKVQLDAATERSHLKNRILSLGHSVEQRSASMKLVDTLLDTASSESTLVSESTTDEVYHKTPDNLEVQALSSFHRQEEEEEVLQRAAEVAV